MQKTVKVPDNVDVKLEGMNIIVKGPLGELSKDFDDPRFNKLIKIEKSGNEIKVASTKDVKKINAVAGAIAAHVRNMMLGTTIGFKYEMKVMYTHFPITVSQSDSNIQIKNFFGEKGARTAKVVGKTEV
ncbi:MAG: 50S ribosomal protein L6, partial [Candidatus Aenigmarchaeota archaeon]|nr:50S ribosomal protein L6 [Candidatus Aenigmarchaeota archaeon]